MAVSTVGSTATASVARARFAAFRRVANRLFPSFYLNPGTFTNSTTRLSEVKKGSTGKSRDWERCNGMVHLPLYAIHDHRSEVGKTPKTLETARVADVSLTLDQPKEGTET
jgi:hypothetical protein